MSKTISKRLELRDASVLVSLSVLCTLALLSAPTLRAQTVQVVRTTKDKTNLLATLPSTSFGTGATGSYTLLVNDQRTYQQWDGVGAALTDSAGWLLWKVVTQQQRTTLLQDLFSPSGAGFDLLRMPMGAADASASGDYSYDDLAAGQTDPNLANFSISHDLPSTIPATKAAFAVNPNIKVFALPWSPPGWMKTSGSMNGGEFLTQYSSSLANYFVKFLQEYQAQGIPIYALSVQNEPRYTTSSYPSEDLLAEDEASFISNYLSPALNKAGYGGVKIIAYEHNWDTPAYPETVLSSAGNVVAGTAWHCYSSVTGEGAEQQIGAQYPGKGTWFTECSGQKNEDFGGSLDWWAQHLLITNVRNGGKSVIAWNVALDQNGGPQVPGGCNDCLGVVTIDRSATPPTISKNAEYYALGQLGKFVRPGAYNIATDSQGSGGIQSVGFKNPDQSIALLVLNGTGAPTTITVGWFGKTFSYSLPAGSVTTFTWQGS